MFMGHSIFFPPPLAGEVASAASRRGDVRSSTGHWPLPPRFAWSLSPASGGGKASSHSPHVERRLLAGAVAFERALVADGVGALEDPVLPGGEPGEDFRFHGLRPGEAQVGFHAGETVGREAGALLEKHPHLV